MSRAPRKPPLVLDMDFSEALKRFAKTDPDELPDKKKKPKSKTKSEGRRNQ